MAATADRRRRLIRRRTRPPPLGRRRQPTPPSGTPLVPVPELRRLPPHQPGLTHPRKDPTITDHPRFIRLDPSKRYQHGDDAVYNTCTCSPRREPDTAHHLGDELGRTLTLAADPPITVQSRSIIRRYRCPDCGQTILASNRRTLMPEDPFVPCATCGEQLDKAAHEVPLEAAEQQSRLPLHAYQCPICGGRTRAAIEGRPSRPDGHTERGSDG